MGGRDEQGGREGSKKRGRERRLKWRTWGRTARGAAIAGQRLRWMPSPSTQCELNVNTNGAVGIGAARREGGVLRGRGEQGVAARASKGAWGRLPRSTPPIRFRALAWS